MESQYSGSPTAAAATGYQQPPAAHQPQPAHQPQTNYERQAAAAYQQYAQQYAQQQSPPSPAGYQAQPSPQSSHSAPAPAHTSGHTGSGQNTPSTAHSSYPAQQAEHSSASAAAAAYHQHQQQQQPNASSLTYAQQAAAAQYNAQMLANYASVANMGAGAHVGRVPMSNGSDYGTLHPPAAGRPKGSPNKSGKRKKNKDPNRPKRPTSAYFFYVQHCREECEKRGERITRVAQWTKEISAVWREMTPEEKKKFDAKAVIDKARYEEQMNRYKGRDKNRPKRPQSAYFLWLAGFRTRMKEKIPVNKELLRAAGEHWKRLTDVEKGPYEQMAEVERDKYKEAMKVYNLSGGAKRARMEMEKGQAPLPVASPSTQASSVPQAAPQVQQASTPPQPPQAQQAAPPQVQAPQAPVQPSQQQQLPSATQSSAMPPTGLPPMTGAGMLPPGMHPSMMAAINMMGMQQSMQQQQQQQQHAAMGGMPPGGAAKNGEADDSDEYDDEEEEYTDEDGDD